MTVFIAFISIFAVVKLFPLSLELLKPPATYGIFALIRLLTCVNKCFIAFLSILLIIFVPISVLIPISVLMAVFTIICVPETRGRSLAEIQSMYGEVDF